MKKSKKAVKKLPPRKLWVVRSPRSYEFILSREVPRTDYYGLATHPINYVGTVCRTEMERATGFKLKLGQKVPVKISVKMLGKIISVKNDY